MMALLSSQEEETNSSHPLSSIEGTENRVFRHPDLESPASRTGSNKCLLCKLPICEFVTASEQTDMRT